MAKKILDVYIASKRKQFPQLRKILEAGKQANIPYGLTAPILGSD